MKLTKIVLGIALAAGTLASGMALADHDHGGYGGHGNVTFGINLGVPFGPYYYPPYYSPYYSPYPPVIAVQPSAPVYVEKGGDAAGPPAPSSNYWFYCPNPQGYFPYVKECQTGWMTVLPQSPAQPGPR